MTSQSAIFFLLLPAASDISWITWWKKCCITGHSHKNLQPETVADFGKTYPIRFMIPAWL